MNLVLENDDGEVISNIKGAGIPGAGTFGYKPPEFRSGSASWPSLMKELIYIPWEQLSIIY